MAINLSDNTLAKTTAPLDAKYGPYSGATLNDAKNAAFAYLDPSYRFEGLTVGLIIGANPVDEYWFFDGIDDVNLIPKIPHDPTKVNVYENNVTNISGSKNAIIGKKLSGIVNFDSFGTIPSGSWELFTIETNIIGFDKPNSCWAQVTKSDRGTPVVSVNSELNNGVKLAIYNIHPSDNISEISIKYIFL